MNEMIILKTTEHFDRHGYDLRKFTPGTEWDISDNLCPPTKIVNASNAKMPEFYF